MFPLFGLVRAECVPGPVRVGRPAASQLGGVIAGVDASAGADLVSPRWPPEVLAFNGEADHSGTVAGDGGSPALKSDRAVVGMICCCGRAGPEGHEAEEQCYDGGRGHTHDPIVFQVHSYLGWVDPDL